MYPQGNGYPNHHAYGNPGLKPNSSSAYPPHPSSSSMQHPAYPYAHHPVPKMTQNPSWSNAQQAYSSNPYPSNYDQPVYHDQSYPADYQAPQQYDEDVIDKFDAKKYTSAFNMVLIGPPRQGKSTIIANFLSLFRERFAFVYIFAEPDTAEELKKIVPSNYVYNTFEPELIATIMSEAQYIFDNTGTKVPILLYFDDMMMNTRVRNHPVFNSLFKTIHHLEIYVWMCIHRLFDLNHQQRPAMHLVGILPKITEDLVDIHKEVFSTSIPDYAHFRKAYKEIVKDKGQCLFHSKLGSGNRISDAVSFFKAVKKSELAPFTVIHPDVYYLLSMFAIDAQERTTQLNGLATHDGYRSALNLPKQEGVLHSIQAPVNPRKKDDDQNKQPLYFRE